MPGNAVSRAWFKDHAERGYQTEINRVLRLFMLQSEQRAEGETGEITRALRKGRGSPGHGARA